MVGLTENINQTEELSLEIFHISNPVIRNFVTPKMLESNPSYTNVFK